MPGPAQLEVPRRPLLASCLPAPRVLPARPYVSFTKSLFFYSLPTFVPTVQTMTQMLSLSGEASSFRHNYHESFIASFGSKELR